MNSAHLVVFAPVDNTARVHAVVRRLSDAIALGLLGDGEQLPSETDLAAHLGVSTVTLREALMALRQQGLIETRRGRGGGSSSGPPPGPSIWTSGCVRSARKSPRPRRPLRRHRGRRRAPRRAALAARRRPAAAPLAGGAVRRRRGRRDVPAGRLTPPGGRRRVPVRLTTARRSGCRPRSGRWWAVHDLPDRRGRVGAEHAAIVDAIGAADDARARDVAESHVLDAVERLIERRLAL